MATHSPTITPVPNAVSPKHAAQPSDYHSLDAVSPEHAAQIPDLSPVSPNSAANDCKTQLSTTAVPEGITLEMCVEIARVSSTRKNKQKDPLKLLTYLINHKHWSPFQHKFMTLRIVTMRGISAQLTRHRGFTFQEMSQRFANITKMFATVYHVPELRMQATSNRQSSTTVCTDPAAAAIFRESLEQSVEAYRKLLSMGIARECARFALPLATMTVIYMTGSVRDWIHFIAARDHPDAQKECRDIAVSARVELLKQCPLLEGLV